LLETFQNDSPEDYDRVEDVGQQFLGFIEQWYIEYDKLLPWWQQRETLINV